MNAVPKKIIESAEGESSRTVNKKNGTVVAACAKGCKHAYQDATYGVGRRLFNIAGLGSKIRCTVCGDTHGI